MFNIGQLIFVRGQRAVITFVARYGLYDARKGHPELLHIHYLANGVRDIVPASIPIQILSDGTECPIESAPFRQLILVNGRVGRLVGCDSRGFLIDVEFTNVRPWLSVVHVPASCVVINEQCEVSA